MQTDWIYYYSKTLEMRYKWNTKTGEVMTEDRVIYTKEELDRLEGSEITKEVHELKKLFRGEIVG